MMKKKVVYPKGEYNTKWSEGKTEKDPIFEELMSMSMEDLITIAETEEFEEEYAEGMSKVQIASMIARKSR